MRRQAATIEALEEALAAEKLTWQPLAASEEAFRMAREWGEQGCDGPGDLLVMLVSGKGSIEITLITIIILYILYYILINV